jgi:hypothetical protein
LDRAAGKTALRKTGAALHEQEDVVLFDQVVNALLCVAHGCLSLEKIQMRDYSTMRVRWGGDPAAIRDAQ